MDINYPVICKPFFLRSIRFVLLIPIYSKPQADKINSTLDRIALSSSIPPSLYTMFIELGGEDLFSGSYVRIIGPGSERQFLQDTDVYEDLLKKALGLNTTSAYKTYIRKQFKRTRLYQAGSHALLLPFSWALDGVIWLLNRVIPIFESIKMPEEIWKSRPDLIENKLNAFAKQADKRIRHLVLKIKGVLDEAQKSEPSESDVLSKELGQIVNPGLGMLEDLLNFINSNLNVKSMIDFRIAFFSGFWDGLVDLVSGFFQLGILALELVGFQIETIKRPGEAFQVIKEFFDSAIGHLTNIDWIEIFRFLIQDFFPRVIKNIDAIIGKIQEKASDSAYAGYHAGYFIFNVAENFFPPLKFADIAVKTGKVPVKLKKLLGTS